ncbi:MAG: motif putative anchor domain protein, partial [Proteobacteria bacterium]|nr:motif putative anchor domain protein [Pseudomonadota bacterium]
MTKPAATAALGFLLLGLSQASLAACPTNGVPLVVKEDGDVIATFNGKSTDTVLHNDLYLDSPAGAYSGVIFNNFDSTPGSSVNLGTFKAGTELVFRLHVNSSVPRDFYTGSAYRNLDGLPHARVTTSSPTDALVEFEDLSGLPECPGQGFNDLSYTFSNVKPANLPPDRFLSYKAKATKGAPKFQPQLVTLSDQIGTPGNFTLRKPVDIASPASVQGSDILSPDLSLQRYQINKRPKQTKRNWLVTNELGQLRVRTLKADSVLLPTALSKSGPVGAPTLAEQGIVDPLTCYAVKSPKGAKRFARVTKTVATELTAPAKQLRLKKPTRLCTPADKDGTEAKHPDTHLMCYLVAPIKGQPNHRR